MLVDVLHGSENKRIIDNGLNKFAEYGLYKEMPRKTIQGVVEWLIKEHFILKTKSNYPVLHMRYEGFHYNECITEDKLEKLKIYLEEEELTKHFL